MKYNIISTQPKIYESFLKTGLIARGLDKKIIEIKLSNLHDFALDRHRSIDDTPYGGGAGMILKVDVMARAITKLKGKSLPRRQADKKLKVVLLTPQGKKFTQKDAKRLSKQKGLILIAGRFEGYDERIRDLADEKISIGDFVLTNGDLAAMVLIDATSRQIPGFIEKSESIKNESFNPITLNAKRSTLLEYPQYTRPYKYRGKRVPEILLSGDHQKISAWRKKQAIRKTDHCRPDLTEVEKMV